ncbi:MAG: S-layer homology domain-containing protein [Clostridia bacterium]|nr:S-layer homology domain-containing protein [Clostridia bacterium]
MKRIISIVLTFIMLLSFSTVFAGRYADVPDGAAYGSAIENLSNYGIVSGYNGSFNPGGNITRAEIAKITAVVGGIDDEASAKAGIKKFSDVELGEWSIGYINAVADAGYILGYPDGNFMPDNNITYAEIVTIVLRLLGYDSSVLGDNWPYAYMLKAGELGITDGVTLDDFAFASRAQVCKIIDNALNETIYGRNEKLLSKVSGLKYSEPVVISSEDPYASLVVLGISPLNIADYTVVRDGKASSVGNIMPYDVVYKSESNKTLYVYCDKISGVYREAYPTKADVESVEISGNTLEIETQTAKDKLGERSNSYKLNSRITALIGKDGKIVDVVDLSSAGNGGYGVLLSVSETVENSVYDKGEEKYYINLLTGDGKNVSYETKKDYSEYIGAVGKIKFDEDGFATFTRETNKTELSGKVDKSKGKIGDTYLTTDATLIELVYEPDSHTGTAVATVIDIEDIAFDEIYSSNVVFALKTGDFDDVSFAVFKNVSNNGYTYGVLTDCNVSSNGMSVGSSYKVIVNGTEKSYSTSFGKGIDEGMPVAMMLEGGTLKSIFALRDAGWGELKAIDGLRVKIGSAVVELSDDVQIYRYSSGSGYKSLSISQAQNYKGKTAGVFTDAQTAKIGVGRVIIIYE